MALCTAHRADGQPCQRHAIRGGNVCATHGGRAPQVKMAAKRRLLEALDPAAGELVRIAVSGKAERDRIAAIREIFARAGFGEADRMQVTLTDEVLDAEIARLEAERE